jgi:predicted AAA+ superfamily ATPase
VLASLDALQAHASEHFALEDQELRQMRDGNAEHLDEHAAVLKSMDEVRGIVAAGRTRPSPPIWWRG